MLDLTAFASVPAIMAICYFVAEIFQWYYTNDVGQISRKKASFIPILCGSVGLILGVMTYYTNPEVIHSDNVLAASANGIASGLASVGIRQMKK